MFKVGDRVVTLHSHNSKKDIGKVGTVSEVENFMNELVVRVRLDYTNRITTYLVGDLILQEIYHSPLYQALKEG